MVPNPQIKGRFNTARVTKRQDLTDDLWKIWLSPEKPFNFKPGQYCTIGAGGLERPYSIVSAPHEKEIEIFIELVPIPSGNLTPILYSMHPDFPDSEVTLRPRAKGIFLFKPTYTHHVMVGTVTGIAPYISMLRSLNAEENAMENYSFHILEGASYKDEFGYEEELKDMADKKENVHFIPSVSRPNEKRNKGWQGANGRVNTLVEGYVRAQNLPVNETAIYACGHPKMIEDLRVRFKDSGFHFEEERFWKE